MFTKVKLKIVQNCRKIPVGGIVALNFGPILNCKVGVGGEAVAGSRRDFQFSKYIDNCAKKKKMKRFFNH